MSRIIASFGAPAARPTGGGGANVAHEINSAPHGRYALYSRGQVGRGLKIDLKMASLICLTFLLSTFIRRLRNASSDSKSSIKNVVFDEEERQVILYWWFHLSWFQPNG